MEGRGINTVAGLSSRSILTRVTNSPQDDVIDEDEEEKRQKDVDFVGGATATAPQFAAPPPRDERIPANSRDCAR